MHQPRHFTRAFPQSRTWQEALAEVHEWMWNKWSALPVGVQRPVSPEGPQVPGYIAADLLMQLQRAVDSMPAQPTKYGKRS